MKQKTIIHTALLSPLLFLSSTLLAFTMSGQDTCTVNDLCETAIDFQNVNSDKPFVCVDGCNMNASPEAFNNPCGIGALPTVWYKIITDSYASLMNISVYSIDFESPGITVFQAQPNCDAMVMIPISQSNLPCLVGSNGEVEAMTTDVGGNTIYYIAVSSSDTTGGSFTLCVNTVSNASNCVVDREILVTARSNGGDLAGPFNPGETVSICMNVNSYTAAINGCQWFQGLIPVFGNGWDPSSFDNDNQPHNTTINDEPIGQEGNGVYSTATWDWFTDADYHYDDLFRNVGDFDGNGTVDMCSTLFEADCPNFGGIEGGCCNPCWGSPLGTILPPGWFAYGINGSCPAPGPPIRVDWGDGGHCGGGQGPWQFCFDLKVRDYPQCLEDATSSDLTLAFFTFADGETGAWTGNTSICALDQPAKLKLSVDCRLYTDLGVETVKDRCAGSTLVYTIDEPGIQNWTWTINPAWAVINSAKEGDNGFTIEDDLFSSVSSPVEVIYFFTGYEEGSQNQVVKQVRFNIIPEIKSSLPDIFYPCEKDKDTLVISAAPLSGGLAPYSYLWMPNGETTSFIALYPPFQNTAFSVSIQDSNGCMYQKEMLLKVQPCHLDTIVSEDESNDTLSHDNGPKGNGNFIYPQLHPPTNAYDFENHLKVFPIPATDLIHVEWSSDIDDATTLTVLDTRGQKVHQTILSKTEQDGHKMQLHVRDYSDGVYIVILRTENSILTSRMVKL